MTGNELKYKRKVLGLTQAHVGEAIGVSPQAVQKQESRKEKDVTFNSEHWPILADILNCPIDDFYPKSIMGQNKQSATASGGSTIMQSGGDSTNVQGGMLLSPKEAQLITINRQVGSDALLDKFITILQEIKAVYKKF